MAADLGFDYDEALANNPDFKKDDLSTLKKWIEEPDHSGVIPKDMHDKQLLLFYSACLLNVEDTKKCITHYYTIRDNAPDHFDDRDCEQELTVETLKVLEYSIPPCKTDEGYGVVFSRLYLTDVDKFNSYQQFKLLFMTVDAYLYENGPQPGFIFVFDMKGVKLGHVAKTSLSAVAKACQYVQDAFPINMKAIHVLNVVPLIDKVLLLLKPFVKKELFQLLHFHHIGADMEKFKNQVLPKRCIPSDFGGEAPDMQTLHKMNTEKLKSLKSYFDAEEKHRHIYSKSAKKKPKPEENFRKLSID